MLNCVNSLGFATWAYLTMIFDEAFFFSLRYAFVKTSSPKPIQEYRDCH